MVKVVQRLLDIFLFTSAWNQFAVKQIRQWLSGFQLFCADIRWLSTLVQVPSHRFNSFLSLKSSGVNTKVNLCTPSIVVVSPVALGWTSTVMAHPPSESKYLNDMNASISVLGSNQMHACAYKTPMNWQGWGWGQVFMLLLRYMKICFLMCYIYIFKYSFMIIYLHPRASHFQWDTTPRCFCLLGQEFKPEVVAHQTGGGLLQEECPSSGQYE